MCTRAVQGRRRYTRARRWSSIPTASRPLPTFSGGGSWAERCLKTARRRIPTEGVRFRASPSCFRPPPLVPGLFWFRARVILLTDDLALRSDVPCPLRSRPLPETSLALQPTRPKQRLPMPERGDSTTHPEPPLLFFASGQIPLLRSPIRAWLPVPATIARANVVPDPAKPPSVFGRNFAICPAHEVNALGERSRSVHFPVDY